MTSFSKSLGFEAKIFRDMLEKHYMVAYNTWEDGSSPTYFGMADKNLTKAERIRVQPTTRIDFLCGADGSRGTMKWCRVLKARAKQLQLIPDSSARDHRPIMAVFQYELNLEGDY